MCHSNCPHRGLLTGAKTWNKRLGVTVEASRSGPTAKLSLVTPESAIGSGGIVRTLLGGGLDPIGERRGVVEVVMMAL
jgi:hypothetical protein